MKANVKRKLTKLFMLLALFLRLRGRNGHIWILISLIWRKYSKNVVISEVVHNVFFYFCWNRWGRGFL